MQDVAYTHVLGIDLGNNLGLALLTRDGVLCWQRTALLEPIAPVPSLSSVLEQTFSAVETDKLSFVVAYEEPFGRWGQPYLQRLVGGLHKVCEDHGIPYVSRAVPAIKLHATGRGDADKADMIAAAKARWGIDADEHACDAAWTADCALKQVLLNPSLEGLRFTHDNQKEGAKRWDE